MKNAFLITTILIGGFVAHAQIPDALKRLGGGHPGGDSGQTASGLKEALEVGTRNTVSLTGKPDGFFRNEAIKILLPEKFHVIEKGLRLAGQGQLVDDFVLSMNRAAEKAAPAANSIFQDAIKQMTFADARSIVAGGDTAATNYFKEKTSEQLRVAFRSPVKSAMEEAGVTQRYQAMTGQLSSSLPFGHAPSFDLDEYVVTKTLDGLFYVLGQEEKKIRTNPAAQVTPLLRQVFGSR
ncbi:MAG: DUF4197 domain-containing protein [Acidobacteria bacterium]|nr:DUF4197 domain-containing protein [Acidobacteriota bacterium]